jgi:hypothetical protein
MLTLLPAAGAIAAGMHAQLLLLGIFSRSCILHRTRAI